MDTSHTYKSGTNPNVTRNTLRTGLGDIVAVNGQPSDPATSGQRASSKVLGAVGLPGNVGVPPDAGKTFSNNTRGQMKKLWMLIANRAVSFATAGLLIAGGVTTTAQAREWHAIAGAESADRGRQALAFLPNEIWIHASDSIRWSFPTHERHTVSFLKPGQVRPAPFGQTFGILVGCPGTTPDGSNFDGSACITSDILLAAPDGGPQAAPPTFSVTFPTPGQLQNGLPGSPLYDRSRACRQCIRKPSLRTGGL